MRTQSRAAIWAAIGATVAVLAIMASPAVAEVVSVVRAATVEPKASDVDEKAGPATEVPTPADTPTGYVYLGQGISIPAGGSGKCKAMSYINILSRDGAPAHATLLGPRLIDTGSREYARGNVSRDGNHQIVSYTVAPGDVLASIGDRFCIYNALTIGLLNHLHGSEEIQPGERLVLTPNPAAEWSDPEFSSTK